MIEQLTAPTIAARLTAEIPAAIATIAIRGPHACEMVGRFTQLPTRRLVMGRIRYAHWRIGPASDNLSEQVVLCRTAEQAFEVHCHGGPAVCQAILNELARAGCTIAAQADWPSDFSCPIAAAAEQDLLRVTTDRAAAVLLDQMNGALRQAIVSVRQSVVSRDIPAAQVALQELLRWSEFGQRLCQPWKIVLAGPPNVGKSSLMNALAGSQQSIVHSEPGTTRDWIESRGAVDGWPVAFTDTAGIRDAVDEIESAGVARSSLQLSSADLALIVVDVAQGWQKQHDQLLALAPRRSIVVGNKADLLESRLWVDPLPRKLSVVSTSALNETGINALLEAISRELVPCPPVAGIGIPFRASHEQGLRSCLELLSAGRAAEAEQRLSDLLCVSTPPATIS